jgi:hypothetical protein
MAWEEGAPAVTAPRDVQVRIVSAKRGLARRSLREPDVLFVAWDGGALARFGCEVFVPPQVRLLMLALAARPGAMIGAEALIDLVYGDRPDGGPEGAARCLSSLWSAAKMAFAALGYSCARGRRGFCVAPALFARRINEAA